MKLKVMLTVFMTFSLFVCAFGQNTVTISGVISDAKSGDPLAGANVSVQGALIGAAAGNDGSYQMKLLPGTYTVLVQYIGYKTIKQQIQIVVDQAMTKNFAMAEDILEMSEIVATGTRFAGRTVIESAVPVDVISAREIHATGATQTTQVLQLLVPSYNAPQPSITDGSDHMRPATLRGMGPDQVLILINGKRRHTSALVHVNGSVGRGSTGVDLNAIPANAIGKIEVLRDGAAAQYGSDAIAGVINIVLKKSMGLDASVSYSQNLSSVTRGFAADEGNFADNSDVDDYNWDGDGVLPDGSTVGPESIDYTDGETVNLHVGYGFQLAQDGQLYVSGQVRTRDRAVRAGLDPRSQYFGDYTDPRESSFDRLNHVYGQGESDDFSVFFNGSLPMGDAGGQVYAFGGYNDRKGSTGCFYRRANDNRTVRSIHPDGFLPTLDNRLKDLSVAAGIKGNLGDWTYDASETFGNNSFNFLVDGSNNASFGNASQQDFDSGFLKFRQATTNLDLLRAVDIGGNSPLNVAVGAEFRWENYRIEPGEANSYTDGGQLVLDGDNTGAQPETGSSCFHGFEPRSSADESRTNFGVYVDLENNLTEQFFIGVAGRFENYSDFGSTVTGKIAGRYEFTEGFALRGAASTGFRAPSLAQANFTSIATNFIDGVPFEVGTFPVGSPVAQALGAKELDAEKSVNLSGGFTVAKDNFSLTADAYFIDINDRIVITENFVGGDIGTFLQGQGFNANGGRYFTNAVETETKGLDIIARYGTPLGAGTFRFTAALAFTETDITNKDAITTPAAISDLTDVPLFGRNEIGRFEEGQPHQKFNFSANYDLSKWNFLVRTTYYGEVSDLNSGAPVNGVNLRDEVFSAKAITDLEASYGLADGIRLAVGSNNLFDIYPDKRLKRQSFNGIFPYNGLSPFGFFGRSVYSRLNVSL